MPATDHHQGLPGPFNSFGRSILSTRKEQIHTMDGSGQCQDEVELFQKRVNERFQELGSDEVLSLQWIRNLLDVFLCCQEDFRILLFNYKSHLSNSPADRVVSDFFERIVKALDVCNAVRDGVEQIKQWQKLVEIVLVSLDRHKSFGEGQFRRAKKALTDLAIGMLDDKESSIAHRNRSFGRNNVEKSHRSMGHLRSLSWSVSRSWSAAKQLQAIGSNLMAPRGNDIVATNGLVVAAYTMSSILLFVMWTLVAAIPCQDRGLQVHFSIPRHFNWAGPILSLHEHILEESKKRERKNACGLLKEIHQIEKCCRYITELIDSVQFPLTEEKEAEVRYAVTEFTQVYETLRLRLDVGKLGGKKILRESLMKEMIFFFIKLSSIIFFPLNFPTSKRRVKEGLDQLEYQVREVFHRIVRSRTEGLGTLGKTHE